MKRQNDGLDTPQKAPTLALYVDDMALELRNLSNSSAGIWVKIFCEIFLKKCAGELRHPSGKPYTVDDIAQLVSDTPRAVRRALDELERKGVYSTLSDGCIYNRRLKRDSKLSEKRRQAAESRWKEQDVCMDFAYAKQDAKPMQGRGSRARTAVSSPSPSSSALAAAALHGANSEAEAAADAADKPPGKTTEPTEPPEDDVEQVRLWMSQYVEQVGLMGWGLPDRGVAAQVLAAARGRPDALEKILLGKLKQSVKPRTWGWFVAIARGDDEKPRRAVN